MPRVPQREDGEGRMISPQPFSLFLPEESREHPDRVVDIECSIDCLWKILTDLHEDADREWETELYGFPKDAKVESFRSDDRLGIAILRISHHSFAPVQVGAVVPSITIYGRKKTR